MTKIALLLIVSLTLLGGDSITPVAVESSSTTNFAMKIDSAQEAEYNQVCKMYNYGQDTDAINSIYCSK